MKPIPIPPLAGGVATASTPAAAVDMRWRVDRLLSAPHRLGFAAAAAMLATSALWWALILGTRHAGIGLPWAVPPPVAHGLFMALGFMPLFIVGFLFTAGPRWLVMPDVDAVALRAPVAAMLGGWALALLGFHASTEVAAAGVAAVGLGWFALVWRFLGLLRASPATDKLHASLVAVAAVLGVVAMAGAAWGLALGQVNWTRMATRLALWGFLAPTFAVVSHRMLPFLTASALPALPIWRPNFLLGLMVAVLWLQGGFAMLELAYGPLPAAAYAALALVEAAAAALLLWVALRWGLVQSLKVRLLAMLHAGFVWLGLSLALSAVSHTMMASSDGAVSLGLAPLHALTMGYLGATLIAMATRVASGHSGRALAADDLAWALYWALQTAAVLRVVAALWPAAHNVLTLSAVAAWCVAATGWAWRYGAWMGRPRADGRPG